LKRKEHTHRSDAWISKEHPMQFLRERVRGRFQE
jgi:hypothetical protein